MTVQEMTQKMSGREFVYWMAYYNLEPFDEVRADLRAGIIASTIANVNRGKGRAAFKPDQFMPEFSKPEPKKQSVADMMRTFRQFTTEEK